MKDPSIAGALVDCTVVVIAFLAWRADPSLQWMFVGTVCSITSARVALMRKGPPGGGGGSITSSSATLALLIGFGVAAYYAASHFLGRGTHAS